MHGKLIGWNSVDFSSKLFGTVETLVRPRACCGAVIACGGCA